MASEKRRSETPARSPEQRLRALAIANEVRTGRAQLKRDIAAGTVALVDILASPPGCAHTARVAELLLAVPGVGPARVRRMLAHCRISEAKTLTGLTGRQRADLINLLRL